MMLMMMMLMLMLMIMMMMLLLLLLLVVVMMTGVTVLCSSPVQVILLSYASFYLLGAFELSNSNHRIIFYYRIAQQGAFEGDTDRQRSISFRDSAAITFLLDFLRRTPSLRVILFFTNYAMVK